MTLEKTAPSRTPRHLFAFTVLVRTTACFPVCLPISDPCSELCGSNRHTFDSDCDGAPCGWIAESGSITRVPTIHAAIPGVELTTGTTVMTSTFVPNLSQLKAELVAQCDNAGIEVVVSNPGGTEIASAEVSAERFRGGGFDSFTLLLPITGPVGTELDGSVSDGSSPDGGGPDGTTPDAGVFLGNSCSAGGNTELRLRVIGAGSCKVESIEINPCA